MALPRALAPRAAAFAAALTFLSVAAAAQPPAATATPDPTAAAGSPSPRSSQERPFTDADVALLAAACANCHGPDGRSTGGIPSLRDQDADHLLSRMEALRQARPALDATVMPRLMKGYDRAEMQALARWFGRKEAR